MLKNEARWLGQELSKLEGGRLFPLLNVGSSTSQFRESDQPWIDEYVFRPLRNRGGRVIHFDLKEAPGVDIAGDLNSSTAMDRLRALGARSVFCSNMLEHVEDRPGTAARLVELVAPGGYLILSVPNAFPYHPDPIDTMYRPGVWELARLFPTLRPLDGDVVPCGTVLGLLDRNVTRLAKKVTTMALPRRPQGGTSEGPGLWAWVNPWLVKQFRATCLILEKPADAASTG